MQAGGRSPHRQLTTKNITNIMNIPTKIALITGANKGLGLETARQLARDHGFTVLIGARDQARGQKAAAELKTSGLDAHFLLLNPTNPASVEHARAEVEEKFGRLDVLVNNAGTLVKEYMAFLASPASVPTQVLRETFDINVFGVHEVTRAFWPLLEKSDAARLVNVSSIVASLTIHFAPNGPFKDYKAIAYSSSKAALNMMTIHYAWQWRDSPHRANMIDPGNVRTELNQGGELSVEDGAKTSVELATIGVDGPNGGFFHEGEKLPW